MQAGGHRASDSGLGPVCLDVLVLFPLPVSNGKPGPILGPIMSFRWASHHHVFGAVQWLPPVLGAPAIFMAMSGGRARPLEIFRFPSFHW